MPFFHTESRLDPKVPKAAGEWWWLIIPESLAYGKHYILMADLSTLRTLKWDQIYIPIADDVLENSRKPPEDLSEAEACLSCLESNTSLRQNSRDRNCSMYSSALQLLLTDGCLYNYYSFGHFEFLISSVMKWIRQTNSNIIRMVHPQ